MVASIALTPAIGCCRPSCLQPSLLSNLPDELTGARITPTMGEETGEEEEDRTDGEEEEGEDKGVAHITQPYPRLAWLN